MVWLGLFMFGIAVGIVSGMLGIGGGVLLIPGLVLLFGFSQQEAQGTSLAVLIPPIGIFAAIVYYQHGFVRLPVVGLVALGFVLGAPWGAKLVSHLPVAGLRLAFGILLLYLGFHYVMPPRATKWGAALPAGMAAVASAIIMGLTGRRRTKASHRPAPPDDDTEYHI